jgi:glycosyltransferase involved in cell wall biosynthesis
MKISVVIACFNYGRYLKACLDSVLAQTHHDLEVIVVDDGSTDESASLMKSFADGRRVRYHYQSNQGQAVAKNTGLRLTTGELVAFLDADDLWLPDKLAMQVRLFSRPSIGVVYSGYATIDDQQRPLPSCARRGYMTPRRGRVTKWLAFDNFVPYSASVVRAELLRTFGAFDETLGMGIDWDLWLRLSCHTEFDFVPDPLLLYRVGHSDQMSKNWRGRLAASDQIFQRFLDEHPNALAPSDVRRIRVLNACTRATAYRQVDLRQSTVFLWQALRIAPWAGAPYLGLLRNGYAALRHLRHGTTDQANGSLGTATRSNSARYTGKQRCRT